MFYAQSTSMVNIRVSFVTGHVSKSTYPHKFMHCLSVDLFLSFDATSPPHMLIHLPPVVIRVINAFCSAWCIRDFSLISRYMFFNIWIPCGAIRLIAGIISHHDQCKFDPLPGACTLGRLCVRHKYCASAITTSNTLITSLKGRFIYFLMLLWHKIWL